MVHVEYKTETSLFNRLSYEDNHLVRFKNREFLGDDDYGDEDCTKSVTYVGSCDVYIDAAIAEDFKDIPEICFVRYDFYSPAYSIHYTQCTKEYLEDGGIVYHFVREGKKPTL